MSSIKLESDKNACNHNSSDNDYDDEDDFISFQYESETISLYYTHLSKYSRLIRKEYLYSDVKTRLPQELHNLQAQYNIDTPNVFYFFKLLQKDFVINEKISFKQYTDLYKISEFLQSKKILKKLIDYFNTQKVDTDFAIQIILHEIANSNDKENYQFQINKQMEEILSGKVNECLQNDKFSRLPIHCIYRIVEKCDMKKLSMDFLYDFIKTDLHRYYVLFTFMNLENLSNERISDLYENFSNNSIKPLFTYLKCNLDYIMELRESNKNTQSKLSISEAEKSSLSGKLREMQSEIDALKEKLGKTEREKSSIESEKEQLRIKTDELEKAKKQLVQENANVKKRLDEAEKENRELREEIEREKCQITGVIEARVKSGLLFYADIKLNAKGVRLDQSRSRYILSASSAKNLGEGQYEDGEPITSLNQTTHDLAGKPGTYYVRAFVADSAGKFVEIVSNPVTTSGESLPFSYEGRSRQVLLAGGKYRLEVWGGEGGSSDGSRKSNSPGKGGKGGYSKGAISLSRLTKLFILVGGQGKSANSTEGAETKGAFPDGGGTKTGHDTINYTSVPGTGGGSSSIRIANDSAYSRVIVAGGGGGADSDYEYTNHGGYGGGITGGNGCFHGSVKSQGAGREYARAKRKWFIWCRWHFWKRRRQRLSH